MSEPFMTITPRSKEYVGCNIQGIPIKVIQEDGVEYNPHIKFTEVEMENGIKRFHNNSGKSDSFTITCIFNEEDTVRVTKEFKDGATVEEQSEYDYVVSAVVTGLGKSAITKMAKDVSVIEALDYYIRKGEPFFITTRAVGINTTDEWRVTENKERVQNYDDGYTVWSLTFTKAPYYYYSVFDGNSAGVDNALKKYNKAQEKKAKATALAKKKKTAKYKLQHECKASNLKYSKTKKVVTCVKYMQQILINKKFLKKSQKDGWYGKTTKNALKEFQKKYKEKYKCKTDGNVDKNTFKALYSV